jgi:NADPH2:quinone reductase
VVGFAGGPIPALPANLPLMKGAAMVGVDVRKFSLFEPETATAHLTELLDWVADCRLIPPVGRAFTFDQAREALTFALTGTGLGKTALTIG